MIVVTTAPSYLFWRCAPPELRVPQDTLDGVARRSARYRRDRAARLDDAGDALRKLGVDAVVMGECEEVLARLADTPRAHGAASPGCAGGTATTFACKAVHRRSIWPCCRPCIGRRSAAPPCAPSSSLRYRAGRAGRRDRGIARLSLSLFLLRQGQFPRPLPPPAARDDSGGVRRADRRRRRLCLFHRRDLPALARVARGSRAAADPIRRADAHRSVEAGDARPARGRGLRLDRGRRREPDPRPGATRSTKTARYPPTN